MPASPPEVSMSFSGRAGDFLKLIIKGALLLLPTFGFYRFWLITKTRSHLWANTKIGNDSFRYTGTAKELLIGFLIAIAVLLPLSIIYAIAAYASPMAYAVLTTIYVVGFYMLAHLFTYRARRYLATRTVFRGLRFWMKGSGFGYTWRAILWDLAMILTSGLALPWATASLERYRMRNTYFGNIQGDFVASGWTLFKRGFVLWLIVPATIALGAFVVSFTKRVSEAAGEDLHQFAATMMIVQFAPIALLILFFLAMVIFLAIAVRWQVDGLRMGGLSMRSSLRFHGMLGQYLKMIGSLIVFTALCVGGAVAVVYLLGVDFPAADENPVEALAQSALGVLTLGIAYIGLLLGMSVITRYFMLRGVWKIIASSTTVVNLAALDGATSDGAPGGVVAEGFADALDLSPAF
jgi:uncharacterized membrane protein YjgN (DUF898 family)